MPNLSKSRLKRQTKGHTPILFSRLLLFMLLFLMSCMLLAVGLLTRGMKAVNKVDHSSPLHLVRPQRQILRPESRPIESAQGKPQLLADAVNGHVWEAPNHKEQPESDADDQAETDPIDKTIADDNMQVENDLLLNEEQPPNSAAVLVPSNYRLPLGFQHLLQRAKAKQSFCHSLDLPMVVNNNTLPDLPNHGIIHALESYRPDSPQDVDRWDCHLPPTTECNETQFTVVFMGYNPERLDMFRMHVLRMTDPHKTLKAWKGLIREAILVWNGPRELNETETGRTIQMWAENPHRPFRIFYPLKDGFPNDLMNRYHPRMNIQTKAILFYDDDGPFYSVPAVTSGFELWKRNSDAQIGAMARVLDVGKRALLEKESYPRYSEHEWIGHCRDKGDSARYNFNYFANFGANMALPSGSFLHSNYLCFLWHPALEEIRTFVRAHPVHPDDVTVSTIVSHVSGRAPKVYSRRIKFEGQTPRNEQLAQVEAPDERRRRLLWDDGDTAIWAQKREASVNSLLSYFGSINSGANGWCYGTPYHVQNEFKKNNTMGPDICEPWMARGHMLPWMTNESQPLDNCPGQREVS
jgi:hypothetical protein